MSENRAKVYVGVDARFDTEGRIIPLPITWEDGRVYGIDRVLDMRRAASLKAGGAGTRYTVRTVSYTHLALSMARKSRELKSTSAKCRCSRFIRRK